MNHTKFVIDMLDLLKRHSIIAENGNPEHIKIELLAPFDVYVRVDY